MNFEGKNENVENNVDEELNNTAKTESNNTVLDLNDFFLGNEGVGSLTPSFSGESEKVIKQIFTGENVKLTGANNSSSGDILAQSGINENFTGIVDSFTGIDLELSKAWERLNKNEIHDVKEYNKVSVDVLAQSGTFPEGTELRITPITVKKELNDIKNNIIDSDQGETVIEKSEIVAFDISFIYTLSNGEEIEVQPKENTVKVTFNYEDNKDLSRVDDNEKQGIKVFHIDDKKDEEGNKTEEKEVSEVLVNKEESKEAGIVVVDAESFSIYAVIRSDLTDIISITYDANGGIFKNSETTKVVTYTKNGSGLYIASENVQAPNKSGKFMFDGWYTDTTYSTEWYGVADDTASTSQTVYAKWLPFDDFTIEGTNYIIMDRNLGATDVWEYGDAQNTAAKNGKYYQWGNNHGFPASNGNGNTYSYTSSTPVDANNYGPGNYYSSSTFILRPSDNAEGYNRWDTGDNGDLWGGNSKLDADRQGPCPEGYHVPTTTEWKAVYDALKITSSAEGVETLQTKLKLPLAGYRYRGGSNVNYQGAYGYYRSSTRYNAYTAYDMRFNSGAIYPQGTNYRSNGFSVRCFKDSPAKTLTFDAATNGGTTSESSITQNQGTSVDLPTCNASKSGYTCIGWNTDKDATTALSSVTLNDDTAVYAIFKKTITASFNANGADSIEANSLTCDLWNNNDSCTVTAPSITRADWNILGWNTNANATIQAVEVGGTITLAADTPYYAITSKTYTANFTLLDPNAATLSSPTSSCTAYNQGNCSIPAPSLTPKSGYIVLGWSITSGGIATTESFTAGNTYYSVTKTSVPLTAFFTIQDENAVVDGIGFNLPCEKYNGATSCSVISPSLTANNGYTFLGWNTNKDATESNLAPDSSITISSNTYYFSITKNNTPITITFNVNGNQGNNTSQSCYKYNGSANCSVTSPGITPVNGFIEIGWSTAAGTHSNQWTGGISKSVSANADFFAQSSKNVSATFKANGNKIDNVTSDVQKSCTRYNGEQNCTITSPTITANGNNTPTIVGYTDSSAGVGSASIKSNASLQIAGGETYYAHTKKDAVTKQVTFNLNGNTKFKYGSHAESTTTASYDLCTIAETYDGVAQASNCSESVTCPKITASANTPNVIGWSEGATDRNIVCTSEGTATLEGGKTYYAQTKKPSQTFTGTFIDNGATSLSKYTDSCSLSEIWNGETRSETCNVIAPTITRDGWTKLGFNTNSSAESATYSQGENIPLSSDATYYAITKKEAINLIANVDGNNSTLSSNDQLSCTLAAVYNTNTQEPSCEVTMPTVIPNTNTPNFIGWNTPSTSKTNNASYNTSTKKLTLTSDNTAKTWYAITKSDDKVLQITYEKGTGVNSIGKTSDSCTLTGTYNGEAQATSCTVKAPTITVSEGYKDSDKKWTESGTNIVANAGADITLTQNSHYTAGAKYIADTNPMDDLQYIIRYEDGNGKTLKTSDTIGNQIFGTTHTVTAPDIDGYITPSSQQITIAVTNSDVVFVYTPRTDIEYTVTYKDINGNPLLTTKTVNTGVMDTEVSEIAPEINGYTVQTGILSITLKATNNHIDFVYTPNNDISYTVYYKSGDKELHTAKVVSGKTMATQVTESAEIIPGYTVDENSKTLTLGAKDNVITFNYTPNTNISYIVKYQTANGSGLVEDKIVKNQTMASKVNETAIDIAGYIVDQKDKSLILAATDNQIIFIYTPIEYGIRFVDESNIHPTIVYSGGYSSEVNQNYPEWTRPGYSIHWDKSIPKTMPLEGLTITASWTADTYTVSFNANQSGVSNPENQSVTYDSTYGTLPPLSKDGYTFNGWKDGENFVTSGSKYTTVGNKTLVGDWTVNGNTSYKIEHYKEKLDGTYEKVLTEDKTGETDTMATAIPKEDYEGFTYSGDVEGTKVSGNIEGDGSLVLKLYYTRNSYNVVYQFTNTPSGHSSLPATQSHKYGETVSIADNATALGYSFAWNRTESFTMPAEEVTILGTFSANSNTSYTVEYYYQQADGSYPTTATKSDTTRKGTTDTTVSVSNEDKIPTENGYAFDETNTNNVLEGTIVGNGSLILKVYFKKQFTVRYLTGERGTFEIQTNADLDYGTSTPAFEGNTDSHVDGYIFAGRSPTKATTVTENVDYVAQWYEDFNNDGQNDAQETKYTVTYTDGVDGEVIFADQKTENILSGTATPLFNGTQNRQNYVFAGWFPTVAEKVTANATYTAQWKADTNNNGVADENETYLLTINYVYAKGGEATPSYTEYVLKGENYNKESPSVSNYKTEDTTVSGTMPGEPKTITVTYIPVNDTNNNNIADEEETKYTLTIKYQDIKGNTIYDDYSKEYVAGAHYERASQTKEFYTITSGANVSGIMPESNHIVTVIYKADLDANNNGIADQNETKYTLTIHYVNAKGGKLYNDYTGQYVAGAPYSVPSNISDSHYTIESGKETVSGTMSAEDKELTVVYTAKTDANNNGKADEEETSDFHTLTIHYKNSKGDTLFNDYTASIVKGANYSVPSPTKEHYTRTEPVVTGIMGDEDVDVVVTYNTSSEDTNDNGVADEDETPHALIVMYRYSRGEQASEQIVNSYLSGISYRITSPIIANYTADKLVVEGVMGDDTKTVVVTYTPDEDANNNGIADALDRKYTATVHYEYSRGGIAHADNTVQDILSGLTYSITSPVIEKYNPSEQTISGTITGENVEFTVIYTPNTDVNNDGYADEDETKYNITYTDGVLDSVIFENKVFSNLLSGTLTPSYEGTPRRTNYIFSGWTPNVAEKVTGNATYTAQWKEDMNNNGIDDDLEGKHVITIKDGDAILATIEMVSGAVIKLPTPPTKPGYTFDGWDGLPADGKATDEELNITAKWKANTNNTNIGGGGGGGGGSSSSSNSSKDIGNDKAKDNEKEHDSANKTGVNLTGVQKGNESIEGNKVETSSGERDGNNILQSVSDNVVNNTILWNDSSEIRFSQEVLDAYKWAYSKDITTIAPLEDAMPDGWLYRQHMAKMVVNYAVNVLGMEIPKKSPRKCLWKDGPNSFESQEMVDYALKACKLGLMGIDMDYFQPNAPVTRAQFGTILGRLLYGTKFKGLKPYYRAHLNALKRDGIMTQIDDPENRIELRERVWVMLMRVKDLNGK